jgi:hypothetical protein
MTPTETKTKTKTKKPEDKHGEVLLEKELKQLSFKNRNDYNGELRRFTII